MIAERGSGEPTQVEEFDRFVRTSYPALVRLGYLMTGDRGRGEDLVQTTLVKVFTHWGSLRSTSAAGAYTRKAMVREASRWRRRRWSAERPTLVVDSPARDVSDETARADAVRRALQDLPVAQRAVVVLRYFEQRSEAEIGDLLNIPPGTVKSRAARALASLRAGGLLDEHVMEEG